MSAVVVLPFRFKEDREREFRRFVADGDPEAEMTEDSLPLSDRIAAALEKFQAEKV